MRRLLILWLAGASFLLAADDVSNVRVHVTDPLGYSLARAAIVVSSADSHTQVVQDEVVRLTYGSYTVRAQVPGFSIALVSVDIDQPEQIVVVGMKLGAMEGPAPTCSLAGWVQQAQHPGQVLTRLRLLQLFGQYLVDVPIGDGGEFQFTNLGCGDYMMIVLGPEGCIGTKITRTPVRTSPLILKIPSGARPSCTTLQ